MTLARLIIITAVVLILAYLLKVGFFSYAVYTLLGVLLASWAMARTALGHIRHQRICNKSHAQIGETVSVSTEVVNDKALPVIWALVEDTIPADLPKEGQNGRLAFLRPYETLRLSYTLSLTRRGYHQIGPLVLESGDVFGLIRRFQTGASAHYVTVYPKVVPITRYELFTRRPIGEVRVTQRLYEDPTRVAGLRDYRPGDPLRRIHWRATAKTGRLHSKIYEPSTMIGANIVLDFNEGAWEGSYAFYRTELAVTAAASIAHYVSQQKQLVGIMSNGGDAADRARRESEERQCSTREELRRLLEEWARTDRLRPVEVTPKKAGANLPEIMETLARLELRDGLTLAEMLQAEYIRLPRDAALILIVPTVPPRLLQAIARLKTTGFVVAVFVVLNHEEFPAIRARLSEEGVAAFHIEREADLTVLALHTI
jgi:uncharacterized protein (DUF58 family)